MRLIVCTLATVAFMMIEVGIWTSNFAFFEACFATGAHCLASAFFVTLLLVGADEIPKVNPYGLPVGRLKSFANPPTSKDEKRA